MDSPATLSAILLLLLSSSLFPLPNAVAAELVLEEGYTVTTPLDGYKLKINPYSVLPLPASPHLIVLDSSASSFFTLSLPLSQDSLVERVAGDGAGKAGFADGEPGSALFNKPRSFAVDRKGNIYVADKANHAIRKITNAGGAMVRVVTIAGGYCKDQQGHQDGPAQNATFSSDFELVFVPDICALVVSDHGNRLVRQIDLKAEDCAKESQQALGATLFLVLAVLLFGVICMAIGIAIRPYVIPDTGRFQARPFQHDMEALPNESGGTSTTDALPRFQARPFRHDMEALPNESGATSTTDALLRFQARPFRHDMEALPNESGETSITDALRRHQKRSC